MIKHTIEISERPVRVSLRRGQLVLKFGDDQSERQFACEDIGVLILQHPAISLSAASINALLQAGAAVVICNERHLPSGLLLPTLTHSELVPRMRAQLEASQPARKTAWQEIVKAKISMQAGTLVGPARNKLEQFCRNVRSGDSTNMEAQAARVYWREAFPLPYRDGERRDPDSDSHFNTLLNYGYAIVRASVARALVSAGLLPALGVFHRRRDNPFCLADDLMEPLRPLVDRAVGRILEKTEQLVVDGLSQDERRELLALLSHEVEQGDTSGPLLVVLPRYVSSFYSLLTRESSKLEYPTY